MRWRDVRSEWMKDPAFAKVVADEFPYRKVADAVVGLRAAFALTQDEFAAKVGLKQPFVARMESGKHPVDLRTIKRIADALGVEWSVAFSGIENHPVGTDAPEAAPDIEGAGRRGGGRTPGRRGRDVQASAVREAVESGRREAAATTEGAPASHGGRRVRRRR